MRKAIIALLALAVVGLVQPIAAFARGGGVGGPRRWFRWSRLPRRRLPWTFHERWLPLTDVRL